LGTAAIVHLRLTFSVTSLPSGVQIRSPCLMEDSPIAAILRSSTIVDLSLTLAEDLPCAWPGAASYRHVTDHWYAAGGDVPAVREWSGVPYTTSVIELDEHTGTHFDAPAHFIAPPSSGLANAGESGDLTTERIELEQFIGPAAVIDVTSLLGSVGPGLSPVIEPAAVTDFEQRHGEIAPGDIVLFRTGWDAHYRPGRRGDAYVHDPVVLGSAPGWPAPSPETIGLLVHRGVRCVGTDAVSMGPVEDTVPTHIAGLESGMVYVEALCGLGQLPERGATFIFLPLKIAGGSGGPGRALAII